MGPSAHRPGLIVASLAAALLVMTASTAAVAASARSDGVSVVVVKEAGAGRGPEAAVLRLGGRIDRRIGLIRGFAATVPARSTARLAHEPGIASLTPNAPVTLSGTADGYPASDLGSLDSIRALIGADAYLEAGHDGSGVDVAVIDTGVAAVEGLTGEDKVVNGPDLSFESQDKDLRYLDTFGHGTHMAGIIAGRDGADGGGSGDDSGRGARESSALGDDFAGVAPGARIVSVKVADAFGATDVVQVLAAIDWVVEHRRDGDLDIRVLNLSFGTDATQSYVADPLTFAVEAAWHKGIFVVVAAGNEGYGTAKLNDPAYDPYVMAVGASDPMGTPTRSDDVVASFSSSGTPARRPDLVAPGRSIVSLRVPGSFIDMRNAHARVGDDPARFFRGSGTSQAAAVVSGAAALVIDQRGGITPDQLKRLLMDTAHHLTDGDQLAQGEGMIDLAAALDAPTPDHVQTWPRSQGTGRLELARGSHHLTEDGVVLRGEKDIFGLAFASAKWAGKVRNERAWRDGEWLGRMWTGKCWCASTWAGKAWAGRMWTSGSWSGRQWTSGTWTGRQWTSDGWTGGAWTGRQWTSSTWNGNTWSSAGWGP